MAVDEAGIVSPESEEECRREQSVSSGRFYNRDCRRARARTFPFRRKECLEEMPVLEFVTRWTRMGNPSNFLVTGLNRVALIRPIPPKLKRIGMELAGGYVKGLDPFEGLNYHD